MRGLALSQPWAELVISGRKTIEVRAKNTSYRGWFYVYAAKKDTKEEVVKKFGFRDLPTGVIVGKAFLYDVRQYRNDGAFYLDAKQHLATPTMMELEGWDAKSKWGYIITKVERLKPIPYRGMTGFFPVKLP